MSFTKSPRHIYLDTQSGRWRVTCRDGSMTYFYRAVMAAKLGRDLLTYEHVHHINGDPTDDRPENLALLGIREHGALHSPDGQAARAARWKHDWSRDYPACRDCGTTSDPHWCTGKCRRCYQRGYMRLRRQKAAA